MANDAEARLRAAQGYAELGMNHAAWRELEAIGEPAQRHLDLDVLQTELVLLIKEERWEEGFLRSEAMRRLGPECLQAYIHGGYCLHELGRTVEACEFLKSGPPLLQREAVYHYNLACYYAVLGELKAARKALAKAIDRDPQFRHAAKTDPDLEALRQDSDDI
jgi:Flp pilus assembly protein TadD